MISSNALERWLISITDIPTSGSASRCARASSKPDTGKTAGPALKLKIRSVISLGEGVGVLGVEVGKTTTPYTQNPTPYPFSVSLGEGVGALGVEVGKTTTPYTQNPTPYPFSVCARNTAPAARRISERDTTPSLSTMNKFVQPE